MPTKMEFDSLARDLPGLLQRSFRKAFFFSTVINLMAQTEGISEPLWSTVNKDYKSLEYLVTQGVSELLRKTHAKSVAFFDPEHTQKASLEGVARRAAELEEDREAIVVITSNIQSKLGGIR